MTCRLVPFVLLAGVLTTQEAAPLRFTHVFGDHMVLQRDRPLRLAGRAAAGAEVEVVFGTQRAVARSDAGGAWQVTLPARAADATGRELTAHIAATGERVVLHDVVVGDVWLCSGQSNMAMVLDSCGTEALAAVVADDGIRYRPYFERFAGAPQDDLPEAASWRPLTRDSARACTAVGYWFAASVRPAAGVPIGLLTCAVGGTEIECWLSPAVLAAEPELAPIAARLEAAIADWQHDLAASLPRTEAWLHQARTALAAGRPVPPAPRLRGHPNEDRTEWHRTGSLWHGMVAPLTGFPLRGVLWYQGENNAHEDAAYATKLRTLISSWRAAFGTALPFYYVQLPAYGAAGDDPSAGDGFAPCRNGQRRCAALPGVGMAVTLDAGEANDIHPRDKRTVGERLARFARRDLYGERLVAGGPLFVAQRSDGSALRLTFADVGAGLVVGARLPHGGMREVADGVLQGFTLAGADRVWHHAEAQIDGDTVLVRCQQVPEPVAVRYAHAANPIAANLYNRDGLPAAPFRSDDW